MAYIYTYSHVCHTRHICRASERELQSYVLGEKDAAAQRDKLVTCAWVDLLDFVNACVIHIYLSPLIDALDDFQAREK